MAWIRASQGGGGPTPTRITPGNSNPPYLVEDEVYEMNGNGRAIGSLTSLTPSNDSPVFLNPNDIYKPDVSGYAVGSVTPITPSNSTPAPLSTSYVYKPSESGYAIKSYQSITPSSSGAAFNAGFVKMSAGGYACTSKPSGMTHLTCLGVNLGNSSSKNRTLFSYKIPSAGTIKLYGIAYTNTTSNQGYIYIEKNSSSIIFTKYLTTTTWTLYETSFTANANDTLVFKESWDGSHTNCGWNVFADFFKA